MSPVVVWFNSKGRGHTKCPYTTIIHRIAILIKLYNENCLGDKSFLFLFFLGLKFIFVSPSTHSDGIFIAPSNQKEGENYKIFHSWTESAQKRARHKKISISIEEVLLMSFDSDDDGIAYCGRWIMRSLRNIFMLLCYKCCLKWEN